MNIHEFLDNLGITYTRYEHPAIFTVQDAEKYERNIPGAHTKNLFVCDESHARHYLVVIEAHK